MAKRRKKFSMPVIVTEEGFQRFKVCVRMRKIGTGPSVTSDRLDAACGHASSPRAALREALARMVTGLGRHKRKGHKRYGGR